MFRDDKQSAEDGPSEACLCLQDPHPVLMVLTVSLMPLLLSLQAEGRSTSALAPSGSAPLVHFPPPHPSAHLLLASNVQLAVLLLGCYTASRLLCLPCMMLEV